MAILRSNLKFPISHLILCSHFTFFIKFTYFMKLTLQIECPSFHLTSWRKSSLIQILSARIPETFRQHGLQAWTNIVDKFTKLSTIGFWRGYFTGDFSQFSKTTVKIYPLGGRLGTRLPFQAFQWFPWNFLISCNLWGNSYIRFLVIIISFCFTCGEGKLR